MAAVRPDPYRLLTEPHNTIVVHFQNSLAAMRERARTAGFGRTNLSAIPCSKTLDCLPLVGVVWTYN